MEKENDLARYFAGLHDLGAKFERFARRAASAFQGFNRKVETARKEGRRLYEKKEAQRRTKKAQRLLRRRGIDVPSDLSSVPPQTRQWAHRAFPHLGKHSKMGDLDEAAARGTGDKAKTSGKWLRERNPLYDPDGIPDVQKIKYLEKKILIIVALFTEST